MYRLNQSIRNTQLYTLNRRNIFMTADVPYRTESIRMVCDILRKGKTLGTLDSAILTGIAAGIERGIYNRAIVLEEHNNVIASWVIPSFIATYKLIRQLVCEKLAPLDTDPALERILFDPTRWETIASIPIYELHPRIFGSRIREIIARKSIVVKIKYTNKQCNNCKKYMIREGSSQTRSADESSTPYQICDGCNTEIRLSS